MIIDSKDSLTAYNNYINCNNEDQKKQHLKLHLQSIKRHIDELSQKNYTGLTNKSLEFVMMFIPNESAYLAALESDNTLWNYAYNNKIVLMTPTNLIAALKMAFDLWKREYQARNIQEIVKQGNNLYEKLSGFVANYEKIGKELDSAQKAYNSGLKQLNTGKGNLLYQASKLKSLGLTTKSDIKLGYDETE